MEATRYSGDCRADDARAVEHGRVQGDGIHQVFAADHVDEECLPRGNVERIDHTESGGQHHDLPHLDAMGEGERRENRRQNHRRDLRADDHAPAIMTVGHDATDWRHDEHGDLAGEAYRAQQQRRIGHAIDQPRLRNGLHPGADQRDQLAGKEQLEVAMTKCAHRQRQPRLARRRTGKLLLLLLQNLAQGFVLLSILGQIGH